jgi:hypothetical protein
MSVTLQIEQFLACLKHVGGKKCRKVSKKIVLKFEPVPFLWDALFFWALTSGIPCIMSFHSELNLMFLQKLLDGHL